MKQIRLHTRSFRMPADTVTPLGIYLRLRDRFPFCQLLESCDAQAGTNSFSYICVQPVAGIAAQFSESGIHVRTYAPGEPVSASAVTSDDLMTTLRDVQQAFCVTGEPPVKGVSGLFGYTAYDAAAVFEGVTIPVDRSRPFLRYDAYQYVIAIDHFYDTLYLCENLPEGGVSIMEELKALITHKNIPQYSFGLKGNETGTPDEKTYRSRVANAKQNCKRGDVFQLVLSRRFEQAFTGDEIEVYRALRTINPSPYLFYFDYGNFRLFGSSPEAQLVVKNNKATLFPIAGTFKRSGDDVTDQAEAQCLLADPKENAEHIMLVDLARNDLSRIADDVRVVSFRKPHFYSHVIHLVSEVTGILNPDVSGFDALASVFPAGTLSGAPKHRALQLIGAYEQQPRGFYGGAIGFVGFDGDFNHAIMIRTFMSCNGRLVYQAGAGIVALSDAVSECREVDHKLGALRKAMQQAAAGRATENTSIVVSLT